MAVPRVTDFTKDLADLVEERHAMIQAYVDEGKAACREELAKFVWSTAKKVWKQINPEKDKKRKQAWEAARGMLKEIVDFELFRPSTFHDSCVKHVLERKVAQVLRNYQVFVLTGAVQTKHLIPKLLGETDELLCVDKPVNFTCSYGGGGSLPMVVGAQTPTQLLNSEKDQIQLHEYLALKFDYETAAGTREFWKEVKEKGLKEQPCRCGTCATCACMQAGCCNRLDKETSGIMVAAKTKRGFPEIRRQFQSQHSLEQGGTEKYYFALVRGQVQIPSKATKKSQDWIHEPVEASGKLPRRGRIEIAMCTGGPGGKSNAWDDVVSGKVGKGNGMALGEDGCESGERQGKQFALTFYDPIAWFRDSSQNQYTLLHLQIITGVTHQIRFHVAAIGFPIVGDSLYGAPQSDRDWVKRVFLHSYQTKFREPFAERWFEATSPLPQDLGQILCGLQLDRVKENCPLFRSRRQLTTLKTVFKQYDLTEAPLLITHEAPRNATAILENQKQPWAEPKDATAPAAPQDESWNNWGSSWTSPWAKEPWSGQGGHGGRGGHWHAREQPSEPGADDDDDDEAWGSWKPIKESKPSVPEPEAKRPRTASPSPVPPAAPVPPVPPAPAEPPQAAQVQSAWKRKESTRQAGVYYYINLVTNETQVEPPPPWEKKSSRRDPNVVYYWNPETQQTSIERPEV